jgi:hypothetical protein
MTGNHQIAFARGRGNAGISPVARHYRPLAEQNVDVVPKA